MLLFITVFLMGSGQALLTSAGYVWVLFIDVFIVGIMFGALHGGEGEIKHSSQGIYFTSHFLNKVMDANCQGSFVCKVYHIQPALFTLC